MNNFTIDSIESLKEFFTFVVMNQHDKRTRMTCFVNAKIRREWLLNHETFCCEGRFHTLEFVDMKGGVWEVKIW